MKTRSRHGPTPVDPIKDATIAALNRAIEPVIDLMMDAGVTVHDFNKLIRKLAVLVAMKRLTAAGHKKSRSRAAIMTGLPRAEIAKILQSKKLTAPAETDRLPARRVLAAWKEDPRFSETNGDPSVIPIYGRVVSFEQLVSRYGGGIPVRAMLDELEQMQAIERLPDQKIKIRMLVTVFNGLSTQSIASVGERSHDMLQTLAHNRRRPAQPFFEGTAVSEASDLEAIASARRDIGVRGHEFIKEATSLLNHSELKKNVKSSAASQHYRIGVTIFYFEEEIGINSKVKPNANPSRRTNLRRQRNPLGYLK